MSRNRTQGPDILSMSFTNIFLLHGSSGAVMVDTGYSSEYPRFRRELILDAGATRIYPFHGRLFPAERLRRITGAHSRDTVVLIKEE
jgi:glyoxylase-like metal-dependent hydrolase (beta-lactamase superfamily II)